MRALTSLRRPAALVAGVLALVVAAAPPPAAATGAAPAPRSSGFGSSWTVYHGNPLGVGVDTTGTDLSSLHTAWASPALDGQLYGEPLVYAGRVFAATENDTVYALAANTGAILWWTRVGTPVGSGRLCNGNIDPSVGITGTPVIDPARQEIFVVADDAVGSAGASHHLVGLDLYTGRVDLDEPIDPPTSTPIDLLQRPGLALDHGEVIVSYGGNAGDCGNYHGTVEAVPESGGRPSSYVVDPAAGERQGAVWMGGAAPVVDPAGNIWFAAGNGSNIAPPYDFSDSVTELSPSMQREQYFAPTTWASDNARDADLGSTAPAFVDGYVLQVGKLHTAYLLDPKHLGGVGGTGGGLVATAPLCAHDPHGGLAVQGSTVFVACREGVTAVQVSTASPHVTVLWTTPAAPDGTPVNGPPIVASGLVWSIDAEGTLWGLDPSTGNPVVSELTNVAEANHFPTPTVADGLLFAPTAYQIYAYEGAAGLPPPPAPVPPQTKYWVASADGRVFSFGGARSYGPAAALHLNAPIVGMAPSPGGRGYWLVASDGGIFAFGNARYYGSMGAKHLNEPIVGIAATPDGRGYWMVASDGGIFAFGDARFHGSMGGRRLNSPIVGMAPDPRTAGYWMAASDGGVFAFGAPFLGSAAGGHLDTPAAGIASDPLAEGYWIADADGDGDAFAFGAAAKDPPRYPPVPKPVAIAATADGKGYWALDTSGDVYGSGSAVPAASHPPEGTAVAIAGAA